MVYLTGFNKIAGGTRPAVGRLDPVPGSGQLAQQPWTIQRGFELVLVYLVAAAGRLLTGAGRCCLDQILELGRRRSAWGNPMRGIAR